MPDEEELEWLQWLNLDLADPMRQATDWIMSGRTIDDPEVASALVGALESYDEYRAEFERRARLRRDPKPFAARWRVYFESIRRAY